MIAKLLTVEDYHYLGPLSVVDPGCYYVLAFAYAAMVFLDELCLSAQGDEMRCRYVVGSSPGSALYALSCFQMSRSDNG